MALIFLICIHSADQADGAVATWTVLMVMAKVQEGKPNYTSRFQAFDYIMSSTIFLTIASHEALHAVRRNTSCI